jgi:hypothetical protein
LVIEHQDGTFDTEYEPEQLTPIVIDELEFIKYLVVLAEDPATFKYAVEVAFL